MNLIKLKSLAHRKGSIGIIGLGYVGLPLVQRFVEAGFQVTGFDIDQEKVDKLFRGETYIKHVPNSKINELLKNHFQPTTDFSAIRTMDAIIICVPTPLNKYSNPDLSYIIETIESIKPYLKSGQLLSLESTTYPGTTDEEIITRIESFGFKVGADFFVVYSPEREDPGNKNFQTRNIPKIISGHTKSCLESGIALYGQVIDVVIPVSSIKIAEFTKLFENIQRVVNIGLVNEMKIIADKMGIDIHEVITAASSKPFGFTAYYPGPGVGGHCIPIDPLYLSWKAKEYGVRTRFIELADEINSSMPEYFVNKITEELNKKNKSIKGSKILILGIAYKKNIDDARGSPSVVMMEILRNKGAKISYSDSYFDKFPKTREHTFNLKSIELSQKILKSFDCIVIAADHDDFDYDLVCKHSKILVDTRGVLWGKFN